MHLQKIDSESDAAVSDLTCISLYFCSVIMIRVCTAVYLSCMLIPLETSFFVESCCSVYKWVLGYRCPNLHSIM